MTIVTLYAVVLGWAFEVESYNVWGTLLWLPVIIGVNVVLIWQVAKKEDDPWIRRLFGVGFVLKMLGSVARYVTVFVVYKGGGDAARYNLYAAYQSQSWRQGIFTWTPSGKVGTQNLELITTAVYTVIGPAPLAGFFIFASFAFWGTYFLYRAFRTALPRGHHRVYAGLIFLLPSLLFWPSSIGKEAWLFLWLGVFAYGVARFFQREPGAIPIILMGSVGTSMIRPHITVLLVASLLAAQAFRPSIGNSMGAIYKFLGIAVLGIGAAILVTQSADLLGIDDLSADSVLDKWEWASDQTEQGGSVFTPLPLTHPLGVPAAIVTMLFRPFPWEVTNGTALIQAVEGLAFIVLVIIRWSSLAQTFKQMRHHPYVTFVTIYSAFFMVMFAGFGNFGILARQRTLMIPLFLVLLALPAKRKESPSAVHAGQRLQSLR